MIDTIAGAEASAIIYSIAETAKANNLKPYDYLNIYSQRFQNIWKIMIQVSVRICFLGQISCQRNVESNL